MFYFVYNVLIILIVSNHVIYSLSKSISSEDNVYGPTNFKRPSSSTISPINNNDNSSTNTAQITTSIKNNATIPNTIKNRDSQLLSLLAARRRQIIQNRLQNLSTTNVDHIIETTTHLNQLLDIISATTRAYIDIRSLRQRNLPLASATSDNSNGGNKTTKYHNETVTSGNNQTNTINGTTPNYSTNTTNTFNSTFQNTTLSNNNNSRINNKNVSKENVSQLAQNSSKLFQNSLFELNKSNRNSSSNDNNSNKKQQNVQIRPNNTKNSLITQISNAQKFIYKAQKSAKSILKDHDTNIYVPLQQRKARLPIDIEQIAYETLGIAEKKPPNDEDESELDLEDTLQVQETNHDQLYLLNFLQNKTINKTIENNQVTKNSNNTLLMSESLYNHFRPLETNLSEDEIQPFLNFGQKITSTNKPPYTSNRITKPSLRHHTKSFKSTDETNLMDINVDRLNIANKVLNIRALPTRPSVSVREYFRPKSNTNNNNKTTEYNVTRSNTSYKGPNNKEEPSHILTIQRKNNNESVNISIKYDNFNETESRETASTAPTKYHSSTRHRPNYSRNNNRAVSIMHRNSASFRANLVPRNHSDLVSSDTKSSPIPNPLSIPEKIKFEAIVETTTSQNLNDSTVTVTTPQSPSLTTQQIVSTNVVTSVSIQTKPKQNVTTAQPEPENLVEEEQATTKRFQIIVADVVDATTIIEDVKEKTISTTQKISTSTFVLRPTTTKPTQAPVIAETTLHTVIIPVFTSKVEMIPNTTPKPIETTTTKTKHSTSKTSTSTPSDVPIFFPNNSLNQTEIIVNPRRSSVLNENNVLAYILTILGVLPLILIVAFIVRTILYQRLKQLDSEADALAESTQEKEKPSTINHVTRLPMIITDANSKWEFPRNKLRLKTLLGEGNFGQVWKAEADDLKDHDGLTRLVAVKTIKDGYTAKERDDLHRELFIMQKIGSHPNVVQLLGCCTDREPYLLIMEYVMYGKLLTYLRDHRTRRDYYNFSDDAATLTSKDLTVFAYCVARGMEYLTSKGIIHRDLAARNILVDHNKLCKISDFGLSRYSPTREIKEPKQPKNPLPVRWMATEALMFSLFTEKSDVWSFGILLWEIVTLGATPYATMSGREVMHCVCDGYRLERPGHCKPEIYRVMARCWSSDPNSRPTFAELRNELAELLENNSLDYSYVDLESFAADSNIYEITNINNRGNYCTIQSRISEFECDI